MSSTVKLLMASLQRICLTNPLVLFFKASWRLNLISLTTELKPKPKSIITTHSRQNLNPNSTPEFLSRIPSNSWDSHMHILDPHRYPLAKDAQYIPSRYLLSSALKFESSIHLHNIVLVQPSIYSYDNSCMLDALRAVGPQRARAVVAFDPDTTSLSTLREWHEIGVRGVRINLHSVGKMMDGDELERILCRYAGLIKDLKWVLQLYVSIAMLPALENIVPTLGVKVCLDHFAQPMLHQNGEKGSMCVRIRDPYMIPGFRSLVNLLEEGNTFVKMSAPYRISKEEDFGDLEPVAKELLRVAGRTKVVFATDWPHTRFEGLDIRPFMEKVLDWCGEDVNLIESLFKSNAEDLWDVRP